MSNKFPMKVRNSILGKISFENYLPFEGQIELAKSYQGSYIKKLLNRAWSPWVLVDSKGLDKGWKFNPLNIDLFPQFIYNIDEGDYLYLFKNSKFVKSVKVKWRKTDIVETYYDDINSEEPIRFLHKVPEGLKLNDWLDYIHDLEQVLILKPGSQFKGEQELNLN